LAVKIGAVTALDRQDFEQKVCRLRAIAFTLALIVFPQYGQFSTIRSALSPSGFPVLSFANTCPTQLIPQYKFRVACSFVRQGKIAEQFWQTFQNGYRLFAFKGFGALENVSSASFNKAAVISGDDLVCSIRENSIGGIAVVVHE
jgi:hypothetical protein